MRIIQCYPNAATRARVMKAAVAMGIAAREEGLCIHFEPPKDMDELSKIRSVLQVNNSAHVEVEPE
jgi:hypothetical protein